MRKVLTWFARLLAGLCAIIFVATFLAALVMVNAETLIFQAKTYKQALQTRNIYDRLPKLLAEQILINLTNNPCQDKGLLCLSNEPTPLRACFEQKLGQEVVNRLTLGGEPTAAEKTLIESCTREFGEIPNPIIQNPPVYLKYLTVQDWEILITTLVPPEQMKIISEQTLDSLFGYLNGENPQAEISLAPIKQALGKNGLRALERILTSQPACTAEQILALGAGLAFPEPDGELKLCNPPPELMALVSPFIESGLQSDILGIPATIPLLNANDRDGYVILVSIARVVMKLSLLLPVIFLVLMTLLAVRSLKSWLKWWGIPLTITALLTVLLAFFAAPISRLVITTAAQTEGSAYGFRLALTLIDVVEAIAHQVATPVMIEAGVILLVGMVMLGASFFVKDARR